MKINNISVLLIVIITSSLQINTKLGANNKWYPIAFSNKYSVNISVNDCNKRTLIETVKAGGTTTLGYATFNHENNTVIIQQNPNDPATKITGLCVASSYLGYQMGYQTNLKTEWEGLNDRLLYAFLNNKKILLIHVTLTPNVESQGIWQWSPSTPFEAKVEIKYD